MRRARADRSSRILVLLLGLLVPSPGLAQAPVPLGPQFQVNSYTTGDQREADVAALSDGRFVVTWWSEGSSGSDASSASVQAQRYGADGTAQGGELQVNAYTDGGQSESEIAATSDGGFVVVWTSEGSAGSDHSFTSIQGQRYAADGSPVGSQFQVNSYTAGTQDSPSVAVDADGDFIVVWVSVGSPGTDSSQFSIQGQRFDASGAPQGAQFQVNSYTPSIQYEVSVAAAPSGDFVVVWQSDGSFGTDSSDLSIQGQRYAADGTPQGVQFQVNSYTASVQGFPDVATAADGDFVVVWSSLGSPGTDSDFNSVQAQRYAADGTPQGVQFQVNTETLFSQHAPTVAVWPEGDFVVTWEGAGSGDDFGIFAQRYAADGSTQGVEFPVNTYTASEQSRPSVTASPDGSFIVAWESFGSPGTDSNFFSIQARRFGVAAAVPLLALPAAAAGALSLLVAGRRRLRRRRV